MEKYYCENCEKYFDCPAPSYKGRNNWKCGYYQDKGIKDEKPITRKD